MIKLLGLENKDIFIREFKDLNDARAIFPQAKFFAIEQSDLENFFEVEDGKVYLYSNETIKNETNETIVWSPLFPAREIDLYSTEERNNIIQNMIAFSNNQTLPYSIPDKIKTRSSEETIKTRIKGLRQL